MPTATPNRLIHEKSPYLQQHAYNPVDWHPWGPETLRKARRANKPILLSIGYSTCHWCHVMAHESFADEAVAAIMNRHFVCIKVDREERPDLDKIYITAVSAMTGSAGWPLNIFLTPEGHPFFGGTYFPPKARPGAPAWPEVLQTVAEHWEDPVRKARLLTSGRNVTATLQAHLDWQGGQAPPERRLAALALERLRSAYDAEKGGFSRAPKFPSPSLLQFLLACSREEEVNDSERPSPTARQMLTRTLDAMARGGIHDQLGGGFHRYATDPDWQIPHFEKMLYDNAQLLSVYTAAYRLIGDDRYARVARRTADYVLRDLRHPQGGFFAAEDADSLPPEAAGQPPPKEGAFFTWRQAEIEALLGDDSPIVNRYFGLRPEGNAKYDPHHEFEGLNILYEAHSLAETAAHFDLTEERVAALLEDALEKLFTAREQRPRPHRDEKILTSWNALMISGLAQAYQVLGEPRYLDAARRGADFILDHLYAIAQQSLQHSWCDGEGRIPGMADDYVFLVQAFLDLYEADFQLHWLQKAMQFNESAVTSFYDADSGGFYLTRPDHDQELILRVKEDTDSVMPSASSVAALNLQRLARLTDRDDLQGMADLTIETALTRMSAHPEALPGMLLARNAQRAPLVQTVVVGAWEHPETQAMLRVARPTKGDGRALAWAADEAHIRRTAREIPFAARAKLLDGPPAAFVCIQRSCREPVTTAEALTTLLGAEERRRPGQHAAQTHLPAG
jgi:uncharacterized protein YyaL (SSP411 family)